MVWHIRGKRILTDSEASAEDAWTAFEGSWLGAVTAGFFSGLLPVWWASGEFGVGILAGFVVGILNVRWPMIGALSLYFFASVAIWKLVPPYWSWGAYLVLAIWLWRDLFSTEIYLWRLNRRHQSKE